MSRKLNMLTAEGIEEAQADLDLYIKQTENFPSSYTMPRSLVAMRRQDAIDRAKERLAKEKE